MQNREPLVPLLAEQMTFLLEDVEKLALRTTSKAYHAALHKAQSGPYSSKAEFILGVGGLFYDDSYLNAAWHVYSSTVWSFSQRPAMLYKLTEIKYISSSGALARFAQGEQLNDTGRLYSPDGVHVWDVNRVWLLAQMHVGRPFVMFSDLTDQHVMRRHDKTKFSAYAKEVAVVIKAGYSININADGWMQLNPPHEPNPNLAIEDLDLSDSEIGQLIRKVNNTKFVSWIMHIANHIKKHFHCIETATISDLLKIQHSYPDVLNQVVNELLKSDYDKQLVCDFFIRAFNANRPKAAPELTAMDFLFECNKGMGFTLFGHAENTFGVKAKIASALLTRVEILIELNANRLIDELSGLQVSAQQ